MPSVARARQVFDTIFIGLFIVGIWIPLLVILTSPPKEASLVERRDLKKDFTFQLNNLPLLVKEFEAFFSDQLVYRENLVLWNSLLSLALFQESAIPEVVVGKNGWLFLSYGLDNYRGEHLLTDQELEQWRLTLEAKRDWLASYGIDYIFVVTPDKQSIYPEYLPDEYVKSSRGTRLDQLISYLNKTSDIKIVDLRARLISQKANHLLYSPWGSHWNAAGAYIAYLATIERMRQTFPWLQPIAPALLVTDSEYRDKDLKRILGLTFAPVSEQTMLRFRPCASRETISEAIMPASIPSYQTTCPGARINALVIHDSFFGAWINKTLYGGWISSALAEHFHKAIFIYSSFKPHIVRRLIDEVKPDVVIEENVERRLEFAPYEEATTIATIETFESLSEKILPDHFLTNPGQYSLHQATVQIENNDTKLTATASDPQIVFPVPEIAIHSTIGIRIDISIPEPTVIQVFYACLNAPFSEAQSVMTTVFDRGRNNIYMLLTNSCPITQLRIDPGALAGEYSIYDIEIRGTDSFHSLPTSLLPDHFLTDPGQYSLYQATVQIKNNDMNLTANAADPQIVFSVPEIAANSTIGVHLDMSIPDATTVQVFYACPNAPFSEAQSARELLTHGGHIDVSMTFTNSCPITQMRIDPGTLPGDYSIHKLEIRIGEKSR